MGSAIPTNVSIQDPLCILWSIIYADLPTYRVDTPPFSTQRVLVRSWPAVGHPVESLGVGVAAGGSKRPVVLAVDLEGRAEKSRVRD